MKVSMKAYALKTNMDKVTNQTKQSSFLFDSVSVLAFLYHLRAC